MRATRVLLVTVGIALLLAAPASADEVLLRSGEVLVGQPTIEGQTLRLVLPSGELRSLPLGSVDRIRHDPGVPAVASGLTVDAAAPPPPPPSGAYVERLGVPQAAMPRTVVPCAAPCAPCPPAPCEDPCASCEWDGPWSLSLGLSFTQAGGNSDSVAFKGDFELIYDLAPWKWVTKSFYVYAQTDGDTDTNRFFLESQVDRKFSGCWYWFVKGSYDTDQAADLDYRIIGTGGIGTSILKGASYELRGEVGGGATAEKRSATPETFDPSGYVGLDFEKKWSNDGRLVLDYDFLPNFNDFDLSLMRFEAKYELPLSACLTFRVGLRLDYQIQPDQPGVDELDWLFSTGLGVSF